MTMNSCAIIGERPAKMPFRYDERDPRCRRLKRALIGEIWNLAELEGFTAFYTGLERGVETWAAETVLQMQHTDSRIRLVAVLPHMAQAQYWTRWQQWRYNSILERADAVHFAHGAYSSFGIYVQNRFLVDHAACLIAVYDGGARGRVANAVHYARRQGVRTIHVSPAALCEEP